MKKIKITLNAAKCLDYGFWSVAVIFAFWADWRMGVALLYFDVMRALEDIQKEAAILRREKELEEGR